MDFWASSESCAPAGSALEKVRNFVEPCINDYLQNSALSKLQLTIRYIPIVMPEDMRQFYKERSKVRLKQNIYDCAPYLDFGIYTEGEYRTQVIEYLRGISTSIPHLKKFGLTSQQIEEFSSILENVSNSTLIFGSSSTTH